MRRGGLPTFKPSGLAPQKIGESTSNWATGDTHQRKTFYNGVRFFGFFWEGAPNRRILYTSSLAGITWETPAELVLFSIAPGAGTRAGNIDVVLKTSAICYYTFIGSDTQSVYNRRGNISNSSISEVILYGYSEAGASAIGGRLGLTLDRLYSLSHLANVEYVKVVNCWVTDPWSATTIHEALPPDFSNDSGGCALVPYKSSSPYDLLVLVKQGTDNLLYYSILHHDTELVDTPMTSMEATLAEGFSTFCASSEVLAEGDPERVHLVYIKSTAELCYRRFQNDAWSIEKMLVASGASYPVIACGSNGKLYVFYVKDAKIWVIHYNGRVWLKPTVLFSEHSYNNPTYLSSNQNVQNGRICLVWTEGTASPYEVWFCYLED